MSSYVLDPGRDLENTAFCAQVAIVSRLRNLDCWLRILVHADCEIEFQSAEISRLRMTMMADSVNKLI
eukprot:m.92596 g.92596  ORF g.92596 m.92596 type:complete len:68 (+) comp36745_c0_seq2:9-212(+)